MNRRPLLLALAAFLALVVAAPAVGADLDTDLNRVGEQIREVRSRMSSAAAERSRVARELLDAGDRLDAAEREVLAASAALNQVKVALDQKHAELRTIQWELAELLNRLADIRSDRDTARSEAESWALNAYMGGGPAEPSIAFSASAVTDVSVGVAYLEVLTAYSSQAVNRFSALAIEEERKESEVRIAEKTIEDELAALRMLGLDAGRLQGDLLERRGELASIYAENEEILAEVERQIDEFEGELAALEREERSIRDAIAAATKPKATVVRSANGFVRPVSGAISSGFGMRIHPITGQNRMHNGIDLNGAMGDPIRAAKSGTVILAGVKGGYGNTIMIDHGGGMVTLYAHQSKLGAGVGDRVAAGQVIGYVGSTGQSTGPHLHFEVRINGQPVDPAKYL